MFWLLYLSACLGHGALGIFALNWLHSRPWPRGVLAAVRRLLLPLILAGPLLLAGLYAFLGEGPLPFRAAWDGGRLLAASYLLLCWTSAGAAGVLQLAYWARRRPALLQANHGCTVDFAQHLGRRPIGQGKHRWLARLPGNQIFQVDFIEKILCLPGLPPAWEGLTILHLSDLHLCGIPDRIFYEQVLRRCNAWQPDLVAVTGDIVDSPWHHRWILPVLGQLRWRVAAFAILGNHDSWYTPWRTRRRLQRLGFHVLANSWEVLPVRQLPLLVAGHEGPWFGPPPDLSRCPPTAFRLLLSHTPDNFRWARQAGFDLMLAGHNHGGQVRLPGLGSVFVPSCWGRRYDAGVFYRPPTLMHVSRGLAGQQPLRYFCRPEVTLLLLRSASQPAAVTAETVSAS
jgi:predicted MPP superfamily phosphohydrolase